MTPPPLTPEQVDWLRMCRRENRHATDAELLALLVDLRRKAAQRKRRGKARQ